VSYIQGVRSVVPVRGFNGDFVSSSVKTRRGTDGRKLGILTARVDSATISLLKVGELKYYFQVFYIGCRVHSYFNIETSCIC